MMKKVRGMGKWFFMLSALLLMFAAVGCDDSDSTEPSATADVTPVAKDASQSVATKTGTADANGALTAALNIQEAEFTAADNDAAETKVSLNVPAGTVLTTEGGAVVSGTITATAKVIDADSALFIDSTGDRDNVDAKSTYDAITVPANVDADDAKYLALAGEETFEWQSAAVLEVTLGSGDNVVKTLTGGEMTITMTLPDNPNLPDPGNMVVWRKDDLNGAWVPFKSGADLTIVGNTVTFTTNHLSWFAIMGPSYGFTLTVTDPNPDQGCQFTWTLKSKNQNAVITGLTFYDVEGGEYIDSDDATDACEGNTCTDTDSVVGTEENITDVMIEYRPSVNANKILQKRLRFKFNATCESGGASV